MSCNSNETPNISKLPQQQKLKYLLCRAIKYGTAKDVQRFRWFKDTIQDDEPVAKQRKLLHLEIFEPLFAVIKKDDTKMYHEVFKFPVNLDCRLQPRQMTALHYAVEHGNILVVAMFLYYGLDPNALTSDNEMPIQLAKSKNMRTVFGDFKQMVRSKFAKKYRLKIPSQPAKKQIFPFLELPRELQVLILENVPILHLWSLQYVSKECRDYFLLKTNANSPEKINLFPRGQISRSFNVAYYPTEYHFFFANGFFELKKTSLTTSDIVKEMVLESVYESKSGDPNLPKEVRAIKALIAESNQSSHFKEKIFSTTRNYVHYYYIQKSEYFGIAIQQNSVHKLPAGQANQAKRKQLLQLWKQKEAELDRLIQAQTKK
jgi:hypothetical protein